MTLEKILCLHQLYRPDEPSMPLKDIGDCYSCTYDEKNKECKKYYPIHMTVYDCKE